MLVWMSRSFTWFQLAVWVGIVTMVSGCGAKTYPVEGKVVFKDGKPLTGGTVEFESTAPPHTRAGAAIDKEGHFVLSTNREGSGAMEGEHLVRIDPELPERFETALDADPTRAKAKLVPSKYQSYSTTPLKFTITREKNFITIELDPPSGR